jgi:hypothetical protein
VVSEDRNGEVLSRYGDDTWDISPWAGKSAKLDIVGGGGYKQTERIDRDNADLMRLITAWLMWGPRAARSANALKGSFLLVRRIFALCSSNGILASDLMRFPKVFELLPTIIAPSGFDDTVTLLHYLHDARDSLGFILVDQEGLKRLAEAATPHESRQTAYIPPRIWNHQVQRLRECLDDFLKHQVQIEECFNFCVEAYAEQFGSLEAAMLRDSTDRRQPRPPFHRGGGRNSPPRYGYFEAIAEQHAIKELLERWIPVPTGGLKIKQFCGYLGLIQYAGLAYIANFTLQRIEEATSLRADCLSWEVDDQLGKIPIICGETTKTDPDSDARWPTSPSVEVAVKAMSVVARLRIRCAAADSRIAPSEADQANPYLVDRSFEPWAGWPGCTAPQSYAVRPHVASYQVLLERYPRLFDTEQLRITEEDLRIAQMLTSSLSWKKGFAVGEVWPFTWHQLRRTGAVNMFASGLLSDSSMQFLMKHATRLMSLYYGRGHGKLHLNEEVQATIVSTMYETMAHKLLSAKAERYVSPLGSDRKTAIVVNLIGDRDAKALAAAGARGETSFREIRLGACTKLGHCEYGGIESVARCAGGDDHNPCQDALFDRQKASAIVIQITRLKQDLQQAQEGSPRYRALQTEIKAMENYLDVVGN